jgi:Na+/H+ antiporter NhaC
MHPKPVNFRPELLLTRHPRKPWRPVVAAAVIACCVWVALSGLPGFADGAEPGESATPVYVAGAWQDEQAGTDRPVVMPEPSAEEERGRSGIAETAGRGLSSPPVPAVPRDDAEYEVVDLIRALAPALVAIILAIITRQVLVALSAGILVAAALMLGMQGLYNPILWVTHAIDDYLFGVLAPAARDDLGNVVGVDYDHVKILVFTLFIGAMIGVIEANGGTRAMVARVTRRIRTRQRGQLGAFLAGLVVFFDDYANAMIVGPSMRPLFDRLRLSREKLAYIVDSTAAPVASIFIGTWLAVEIGYLDDGFKALGQDVPAFLEGVDGSTAFWASIPYRTYAWLALAMVALVALTGRDFAGMRTAESRAAAGKKAADSVPDATGGNTGQGWWLGALPLLVLVGMTIGLLFRSGWQASIAEGVMLAWGSTHEIWESIKTALGAADSYPALVYGSLSAALVAVVISVLWSSLTLAKTMDAVVVGMSRMFAACIILVLAWGLSQGGKDLQLGEVASAFLQDKIVAGDQAGQGGLPVVLLPLAIFVTAGIVSFSTGTSYGTMGILCPAVISITARVLGDMPADQAEPLFYACVGAVLTGAVFGDHCSPISDTTVLSSIASECELSRHVWTQMPYAAAVAVAGLVSMDGLRYGLQRWASPEFYESYREISWAYGLVAGTLLLLLLLLVFGRRPKGIVFEPAVEFGAPGS